MTNIKSWALRLLSVAALGAVFAPWHRAPATAAIPVKPVVEQPAAKIQDRWVKVEPAPVAAPIELPPSEPLAEASQPDEVPVATPAPAKMPKAARKAKRRPQRHVLSNPEPAEIDWPSQFLKAAAKRAGAIQ